MESVSGDLLEMPQIHWNITTSLKASEFGGPTYTACTACMVQQFRNEVDALCIQKHCFCVR